MSIYQSATKSTSLPVIAGVEITTDAEGRFNLNALHKAHLFLHPELHKNTKQPADWLKLEQTRELIDALFNSEDFHSWGFNSEDNNFGLVVTKMGRHGGGTFAHELLAISYAGWISPAFQLQVNQVFLDYRTGKLIQPVSMLPNFSDPVEAARAWADEVEQKRIAQHEAEEAIRTKALIGSKREATAMATAAAQTKRANQLADLLGEGRNYATIKAVERVTGETYSPYPLRKYCKEYDLIPNDAPDKTYGTVKAWPAQAWLSVYNVNIKSVFGLKSVVGGVA